MENLTQAQWLEINKQLTQPSSVAGQEAAYRQLFDFGPLPTSLNTAVWTPEDFAARNFPYNPIPERPPASVPPAAWDTRVNYLLKHKKIQPAALHTLNMVKEWVTECVPPYLQPPGDEPTEGRHHITPEQMQMVRYFIILPNPCIFIFLEIQKTKIHLLSGNG